MDQRPTTIKLQQKTSAAHFQTAAPKTSGFAIAAFILNIVGIFMPMCTIVGIALGHAARKDIRRLGVKGKGLATSALIIGYIYLVLLVVISIFAGVALFKTYKDYKKERGSINKTPVTELVAKDPGLNTCAQRIIKHGRQ